MLLGRQSHAHLHQSVDESGTVGFRGIDPGRDAAGRRSDHGPFHALDSHDCPVGAETACFAVENANINFHLRQLVHRHCGARGEPEATFRNGDKQPVESLQNLLRRGRFLGVTIREEFLPVVAERDLGGVVVEADELNLGQVVEQIAKVLLPIRGEQAKNAKAGLRLFRAASPAKGNPSRQGARASEGVSARSPLESSIQLDSRGRLVPRKLSR